MGRVVHFEVHAENPQRAVEFYSNVLDWIGLLTNKYRSR